MLPEAPLRFSITILPFNCCASGSAMRRAMMSTLPPGGERRSIERLARKGWARAAGKGQRKEEQGSHIVPLVKSGSDPDFLLYDSGRRRSEA